MRDAVAGRRAGVLIPLFSCPGTGSWGIGEIGDLAALTAWLARAGQTALQLLPINEMAPNEQSPYSAMSAMAIDPIYISLAAVPEFAGESSLSDGDRALLEAVRTSPSIDYAGVRKLKRAALEAACQRFVATDWRKDTDRFREFETFRDEQAWWLDDYAIFRAVHARYDGRPWSEWPEALRHRDPVAIADARVEVGAEVVFRQYVQWLAHSQWQQARARTNGVALLGDLPFMVDGDSADVWARQEQFRLDASVGAPPDAFSATGQNWGMPVYRWDAIERDDFLWLRDRAKRNAELYDGYRVDHVVGFYRTYAWPRGEGEPFFTPSSESEQLALGERVLNVFRDSGAHVIAEDLGIIPDFVRASLSRLGVPGFRVFRWEREWHVEGHPFRDPGAYPPQSVAVSGTHDTETLAGWWEHAPGDERRLVSELATVRAMAGGDVTPLIAGGCTPAVRDILLESLFASGSDLTLLPIQDVFGWHDRINEPATVNSRNWTFRLPWPVDRLGDMPEARERQACLRAWARKHARI
jgi:4-alpha-glucanotransferase